MSASPIDPSKIQLTTGGAPQSRNESASTQRPSASLTGDRVARELAPHGPTLREAARAQARAAASADVDRRALLVGELLAHVPQADREAAQTAIPAILDAARNHGSSDPNRIGYLLATAQTESDFGAHMTETGHTKAWFDTVYGCEDGNRPNTSDGFAYRGRGYVQTTHVGRYAELSRTLGLPNVPATDGRTLEPELVAHPEQLTEPKLAAEALVVGVEENLFTHNPRAALDVTIPVGKSPGEVDFYHARGIVNGIVKDQAESVSRHATTYARILDAFRHSVLGAPPLK